MKRFSKMQFFKKNAKAYQHADFAINFFQANSTGFEEFSIKLNH